MWLLGRPFETPDRSPPEAARPPGRNARAIGRSAVLACLAASVLSVGAACARPPAFDTVPSPPPDQEAEPIRAMTFNIRYGTAEDGDDAWPLRRDLTFRVIRRFGPTVLGLQEALRFQLDELERELPRYERIGVGRDDGDREGEHAAILFDPGRLELLGQGTFWLSDTPEVPGSTSWGNRITRISTWGRFLDRETGSAFYVFNTHWDHESQQSRERSAELVMERIRTRDDTDAPVLLMGDFNAGEENAAFRALLEAPVDRAGDARLYDTFRAVHPDADATGTFHEFTGGRGGPKIDAILASPGWRTVDAAIVRFEEGGRYPSDHFPVSATLVRGASPTP